MSVKKITKQSKEYPQALKNIYRPPEELFINGNILPSDENAVAIVGTRYPTLYGLGQCEKLSYELALRKVTVVSGMARGIDSAAHRGAIKAGGRTIAVLGSGHNHIYPPENKKLYAEIVKNGSVISEFPPDTPPLKDNFPIRNRIISGLSKGVIVIEAPMKSGALITADFALEQGKEVFAVPGNITCAKSIGSNRLIKDGAKLVETVDDVLEELKSVIYFEEAEGGAGKSASPAPTCAMSTDEKTIFNALDKRARSLDDIAGMVKLPLGKVSESLLRLELKKIIKALPGEHFMKV